MTLPKSVRSLVTMMSMIFVWIQNHIFNNNKKLRNLTLINDFCECVLKSGTPYLIEIILKLYLRPDISDWIQFFSSKRQHYDFGNFLFYFNSAFAFFFMNNKIYYDTIFLLFLCVLGKVFFLCVSCTLFFLDSRSFHYITFPAFVNASLNRMMILTVLGGKFMTLKLTLDKYFVVVKLIT